MKAFFERHCMHTVRKLRKVEPCRRGLVKYLLRGALY